MFIKCALAKIETQPDLKQIENRPITDPFSRMFTLPASLYKKSLLQFNYGCQHLNLMNEM